MKKKWMIYGSNGYTGQLIVKQAKQQGLQPVLAGRNRETIEAAGLRVDRRPHRERRDDRAAQHVDVVVLSDGDGRDADPDGERPHDPPERRAPGGAMNEERAEQGRDQGCQQKHRDQRNSSFVLAQIDHLRRRSVA